MASLRQGIVMFASTAVGGRQCHSTFTATAATNRRIGALDAFNLQGKREQISEKNQQ